MEHELFYILEPFCNGYTDSAMVINSQAKQALKDFVIKLNEYAVDKNYKVSYNAQMHTSYIASLLRIRKALKSLNYPLACNEICSILHFEPFLQARIKINLLMLLNSHLGGTIDENKTRERHKEY